MSSWFLGHPTKGAKEMNRRSRNGTPDLQLHWIHAANSERSHALSISITFQKWMVTNMKHQPHEHTSTIL